MEQLLENLQGNLPVTNPTLIFSLVLFVILFAPLLLDKVKIPHIIGLILAGVALGENGFGVLTRDESFHLFGNVGLLYIMFLAGMQMDLTDFKRNIRKSVFFGLATFLFPMVLGVLSSYFLIQYMYSDVDVAGLTFANGNFTLRGYIILSSILLSSMYASHTLLSYPIVGRYGVTKSPSVNISIGGTMITTTLALIILAVVVMLCRGEVSSAYWMRFIASVLLFAVVVTFVFPLVADYFFKRHQDSIMQYIFVLALVFLGGFLADLAGLEPIIGAFLVGLSLNRYIPRISPLMNRLDFVGNALFIPFFLIGVGMLIDVRAVFSSFDTLIVSVVMSVVASLSKYVAAVVTQRSFRMTREDGLMMFGLSNSQAAATLAAVMIGYELPIATAADGTIITLFNEEILNGTVVMILVTCTIASFATERAARKLAVKQDQIDAMMSEEKLVDRILVPIFNPDTISSLMTLAVLLKVDKSREALYALNIANNNVSNFNSEEKGRKMLERAAKIASATDNTVRMIMRNDVNVTTGIIHTIHENNITEVVLGLHQKSDSNDSFFGEKTSNLLKATRQMVLISRSMQPINTIKRLVIAVPEKAEFEVGFVKWYDRVKNICKQIGAKAVFYAPKNTLEQIGVLARRNKFGVETAFCEWDSWDDFLILTGEVSTNDLLVVVSSRKAGISYDPLFEKLPTHLSKYFTKNSFIVLYPDQYDEESADHKSFIV